jgi:hypothetical protein
MEVPGISSPGRWIDSSLYVLLFSKKIKLRVQSYSGTVFIE